MPVARVRIGPDACSTHPREPMCPRRPLDQGDWMARGVGPDVGSGTRHGSLHPARQPDE